MANDKVIELIHVDYQLTTKEIEQKFDTNCKNGLDQEESRARLDDNRNHFSSNIKQDTEIYKLLKNLIGIHNIPLWFGAILCVIAYQFENYFIFHDLEIKPDNFYIGIGLMIFVFAFGIFSYYMDAKCEYYLESCRDFVSSLSSVIRDGVAQEIFKENVVVGDLIILNPGDELSTDIKIIESCGMRINTEMLQERERYYYRQFYGDVKRFFEPGDILFYSSYIFGGTGKGIVTRTNNFYLFNSKIKFAKSQLKHNTRYDANPLTNELNNFLHYLSIIAIMIACVFASTSIFIGYTWLEAVMLFIAHYVGIITEALLPTLNVAKTQIAKDLASKNCYIQNIGALETLGKTSVVCVNKTGIITQNRMIVSRIWTDFKTMHSYEFMRKYKGAELFEPVSSLIRCFALCNFAQFSVDDEPNKSPFKKNAIGKPTEVAILRFIEAFLGNLKAYRKRFDKCIEIAFNKRNNCSLAVFKEQDQYLICIKGAPEALIDLCQSIMTHDGLKEFSQQEKEHLLEQCTKIGGKKERMIGIAQLYINVIENFKLLIEDFSTFIQNSNLNMQFLGLVALQNPIRLSVPEAIFKCRRAGIKVILITADNPSTALSVAKSTGLIMNRSGHHNFDFDNESVNQKVFPNIFSNDDLCRMKDGYLRKMIDSKKNKLFTRVTPQTKLRIVSCCRQLKTIVAVTGIGTSDLPIYDLSQVRISLGQYGSDITKNNSDIILLDDNFASIVYGIEQGRVLFENAKKSICYTLSSKPSEILLYVVYFALAIPKMGSSITVLAIDLFTDNLPPIALGYQTAEAHVMKNHSMILKKEKVINCRMLLISQFFYGIIQFLCGFLAYIVVMGDNGFWFSDLLGLRRKWYSVAINDLKDSYGQEWTFHQRQELEYTCHTAYFNTIVVTRIAVLLSCRTRKDSCFNNFFGNRMINFAVFFVLFCTVFLSYYPPFQYSIRMYPLKLAWWFLSVPFFAIVLILDELRKLFIRQYPSSIVAEFIYF